MTKIKSYLGNQCLTSIYYSLIYPYLIYGSLLRGNNYDNPLSQLIRLQNKAVRIMNDVPLRDHITPHYVHLGLLKFRDIVKFMYNCLFLYDYVSDNKPCNFPLLLVPEQHDYFTRSASAQQLQIPHSRINIESSAPPSLVNTIGMISPFIFAINHQKSCSKRHLKYIILLSIDLCVCVCVFFTKE